MGAREAVHDVILTGLVNGELDCCAVTDAVLPHLALERHQALVDAENEVRKMALGTPFATTARIYRLAADRIQKMRDDLVLEDES